MHFIIQTRQWLIFCLSVQQEERFLPPLHVSWQKRIRITTKPNYCCSGGFHSLSLWEKMFHCSLSSHLLKQFIAELRLYGKKAGSSKPRRNYNIRTTTKMEMLTCWLYNHNGGRPGHCSVSVLYLWHLRSKKTQSSSTGASLLHLLDDRAGLGGHDALLHNPKRLAVLLLGLLDQTVGHIQQPGTSKWHTSVLRLKSLLIIKKSKQSSSGSVFPSPK